MPSEKVPRPSATTRSPSPTTATRWRNAHKAASAPKNPDPVQDQHNPSVLHNGMIAPLVPYAIRGAIWYQGESNVGTRQLYPELQKTLIEDWRTRWGNPELPFHFVQLAPYQGPRNPNPPAASLAEMREAQAKSLATAQHRHGRDPRPRR